MKTMKLIACASITAVLSVAAFAQQPAPTPTPTPRECSAPAYKSTELDRKVKILEYPHPKFSEEQVQRYRGSVIVLRGLLCGSGKVTDIKVVRSVTDSLDEEAIKAARKIKFVPAKKDGQDVSQWLQFEYRITVTNIWP